jgi:hypothetical protein
VRHDLDPAGEVSNGEQQFAGEPFGETEAFRAYPRTVGHDQLRPGAVVADQRGQRRVCLAGQGDRDQHDRACRHMQMAEGADGLGGAGLGGQHPGQCGQAAHRASSRHSLRIA